ncbi:hypothetical protein OSCT_0153 [Oscillochloris trichoides DG-6]|uniref:Uncharacterized protein n=1 Tax=Oscillochloris trichoides DG-6 TaxID=765420 RepID=E1IA02_9CHLR|nr:hypothetical protein [Oscillochloris trichoides]EFO82004.1 hypothetical protein OSCT_0153 [Oscillochloris trichoides DG-6]
MTTTITLPEPLATQLQHRAAVVHRSVEALAIEYIAERLTEDVAQQSEQVLMPTDDDADLLALVARIKALPPNPANIIPAKGNLAEVLAKMAHGKPDQELLDALDAAECEINAINRADDIAEGRE